MKGRKKSRSLADAPVVRPHTLVRSPLPPATAETRSTLVHRLASCLLAQLLCASARAPLGGPTQRCVGAPCVAGHRSRAPAALREPPARRGLRACVPGPGATSAGCPGTSRWGRDGRAAARHKAAPGGGDGGRARADGEARGESAGREREGMERVAGPR